MDKNPLVFSMEKVGSSSCMGALRSAGLNPDRGTMHNLDYLGDVERFSVVVTPVRDPIARNVSYFFELFGNSIYPTNPPNEDILEMLMARIEHELPLVWFGQVFLPFTGINIYKEKFNRTRGWSIYQEKFLIIQVRQFDDSLADALELLLGVRPDTSHRGRTAESRGYADLYKRFTDWVTFPEEYVERMLSSKYAKFFYTKKQLDGMRKRWISGL